MIAPQHYWGLDLAAADGFVESHGDFCPALAVGIEDASLGSYHQIVFPSLLDPMYIVAKLALNFFWSRASFFCKHLDGKLVRFRQVGRVFTHADPPERSETIVKVQRSHDVLHV